MDYISGIFPANSKQLLHVHFNTLKMYRIDKNTNIFSITLFSVTFGDFTWTNYNMAANPLEHRNWGNAQSWPCPHDHLVAFLNRFQKLDLNTTALESLHTVTSVASVQLFVAPPLLAVCFKKRQHPHYCG